MIVDEEIECKTSLRVSTNIETYECLYQEHGLIQTWIPAISILISAIIIVRKFIDRKKNFKKKKLYFTALFLFNILCVSALTITYMFLEKMFDCTLIEQGFDFGHS